MIDLQYRNSLRYILKNGRFHEDPNRIGVQRLNIPKCTLDIPVDYVPAISLKKTFPSLAMKELSLFMRGITDIREYWKINVNFWDDDFIVYKKVDSSVTIQDIKDNQDKYNDDFFDLGKIYGYQYRKFGGTYDQMAELLRKMIEKPMSSDLVVSAWSPSDFKDMALKPCHFQFIVDMERVQFGYGFHFTFVMRSSDFFLGFAMNVMYYFYLAKILEKVTGHRLLSLTADLHNVHLYDNAVDEARDVILNKPKHIHPIKNLIFSNYLDVEFKELEDYKTFWDNLPIDAIKLEDYTSYRHYKVDMLSYNK